MQPASAKRHAHASPIPPLAPAVATCFSPCAQARRMQTTAIPAWHAAGHLSQARHVWRCQAAGTRRAGHRRVVCQHPVRLQCLAHSCAGDLRLVGNAAAKCGGMARRACASSCIHRIRQASIKHRPSHGAMLRCSSYGERCCARLVWHVPINRWLRWQAASDAQMYL